MAVEKWGTYFRLVLSDMCIALTSEKGKQLFKESLSTEHMNCYFRLACQITTQSGFAHCGVSSLTVVLNALGIDPGINWRWEFRWYDEYMLDCCRAIKDITEKGISMYCLMCVAICNQLDGKFNRITDASRIAKFREDVRYVTTVDDRVLLVCYAREGLGQVGEGHFAPVAGYNAANDMVLLLDVARFKYPPFWVKLTDVWQAMDRPDDSTGLNRGYMILWRADGLGPDVPTKPPLVFKVSQKVHQATPVLKEFGELLLNTKSFLLANVKEKADVQILKTILKTFLGKSFEHGMKHHGKAVSVFTLSVTEKQLETQLPDQEEVVKKLAKQIKETALCQKITKILPDIFQHCEHNSHSSRKTKTEQILMDENHSKIADEYVISVPQYLTILILSFPMHNANSCPLTEKAKDIPESISRTYFSFLEDLVEKELGSWSHNTNGLSVDLLINEITQLRRQFDALMNLRESYSETQNASFSCNLV